MVRVGTLRFDLVPAMRPVRSVYLEANQCTQSIANIALILGALTAGGGITGYARTGSVPSIAAGVTVGALVLEQAPGVP